MGTFFKRLFMDKCKNGRHGPKEMVLYQGIAYAKCKDCGNYLRGGGDSWQIVPREEGKHAFENWCKG